MIKMFLSTACINHLSSFRDVITTTKLLGINGIEIGSNVSCMQGQVSRIDIDSTIKILIHNYFPAPEESIVLNLASSNIRLRNLSLNICKKAIDLSQRFRAPFYSVHAGYRADLNPESLGKLLIHNEIISYERAYKTFIGSIRSLLNYAKKKGVSLAIEPNVVAPFNLVNGKNEIALMCESWEFLSFFQDIDDPDLGILLDFGHLNVTAETLKFDKYEFVEKVKDKIFAFHIHENNGSKDEHKPLSKKSWIFDIITQPRFRGLPLILEVWNLTSEQILAQKKLIEKETGF